MSVAAVGVAILLGGCGNHSTASAPSTGPALSHRVTYDGIALTVPASWSVIDGAHMKFSCTSRFYGQSNRVFIGQSLLGAPRCAMTLATPPPADGVWFEGAGFARSSSAKPQRLPNGAVIYVDQDPRGAAVTVWVNGVAISIGIGPDSAIEQAILNSITAAHGAPNTPVLGACARPTGHAGPMPTPIRVSVPVTLPYGSGTIQPVPPGITPTVAAFHVWHNVQQKYRPPYFPDNLIWRIYFGVRPGALNTPIWLVLGQGSPTKYGPCGITILASYNASTGTSLGLETVG